MAENEIFITRIRTETGDLRIDYNALAHKPVEDEAAFESMMAAKQDVATAITQENIITYLENKTVASADNTNKLGGKDASEYALAADYLKINKDTKRTIFG